MNSSRYMHSLEELSSYHLYDSVVGSLGRVEHPAPNLEPGDVLLLEDGSEAFVTTRIELEDGSADAVLEVVVLSRPVHRVA